MFPFGRALSGVLYPRLDGTRDHVAKRLQAAGYHTGIVGKWHLGTDPTGFDRWLVLPGQGSYWNPTFLSPRGTLTIQGHATEITGDLGIEFLKTRPAALPENRQTIARDLTRADLKLEPPAGLAGAELRQWLSETPMSLEVDGRTLTGDELVRWKYQRFMRDYLACVQGVDDSVGRVLDFLDESGLAADTVVIYTTDNGWYLGDLGLYDKRFMYEPGLRVPLIARGPGIHAGITPEPLVPEACRRSSSHPHPPERLEE